MITISVDTLYMINFSKKHITKKALLIALNLAFACALILGLHFYHDSAISSLESIQRQQAANRATQHLKSFTKESNLLFSQLIKSEASNKKLLTELDFSYIAKLSNTQLSPIIKTLELPFEVQHFSQPSSVYIFKLLQSQQLRYYLTKSIVTEVSKGTQQKWVYARELDWSWMKLWRQNNLEQNVTVEMSIIERVKDFPSEMVSSTFDKKNQSQLLKELNLTQLQSEGHINYTRYTHITTPLITLSIDNKNTEPIQQYLVMSFSHSQYRAITEMSVLLGLLGFLLIGTSLLIII